jgi:hypothetical protein
MWIACKFGHLGLCVINWGTKKNTDSTPPEQTELTWLDFVASAYILAVSGSDWHHNWGISTKVPGTVMKFWLKITWMISHGNHIKNGLNLPNFTAGKLLLSICRWEGQVKSMLSFPVTKDWGKSHQIITLFGVLQNMLQQLFLEVGVLHGCDT